MGGAGQPGCSTRLGGREQGRSDSLDRHARGVSAGPPCGCMLLQLRSPSGTFRCTQAWNEAGRRRWPCRSPHGRHPECAAQPGARGGNMAAQLATAGVPHRRHARLQQLAPHAAGACGSGTHASRAAACALIAACLLARHLLEGLQLLHEVELTACRDGTRSAWPNAAPGAQWRLPALTEGVVHQPGAAKGLCVGPSSDDNERLGFGIGALRRAEHGRRDVDGACTGGHRLAT